MSHLYIIFYRYKSLSFIFICFSLLVLIIHLSYNRGENLNHTQCNSETSPTLKKGLEYHGNYIVLKNYVRARRMFHSDESITLTTPGDFRFLDNVPPLVEKWNGPISIALYAPGDDFLATIQSIGYLRKCTTSLTKEYVTFHLFFDVGHMPNVGTLPLYEIYQDDFDCSQKPSYETINDTETYKSKHGLFFPINVARNIAKLNAETHFVFPSDIELYPTKNFISKFFDFAKRNPQYFNGNSKNVYVLPIFEILAEVNIPETKNTLRLMYKNRTAFGFHEKVCPQCHNIPYQQKWIDTDETDDLNIFTSAKRQGKHAIWEPFFVCTQEEPLWDERLNWEGQGNKMCQAYHLCMLDYNFLVFDNAFLIHKPGIKKKKIQIVKYKDQLRVNNQILRRIQKELKQIYGNNKEDTRHCVTH